MMEAVNWNEVLETTMGDEELAQDIASAFMEETPTLFQAMQTAINTHDVKEAKRAAHTIKGSLKMMSALGVETAQQLEAISVEENWDTCQELAQQLEAELKAVYLELKSRLDS